MQAVNFRNTVVRVPQGIDELSPGQYERWLLQAILFQRGAISMQQLRDRWLSALLGLTLSCSEYRSSVADEARALQYLLEPFFETGQPVVASLRNLLPEYRGWKAAVGHMLEGLRFGPFTDCISAVAMIGKAQQAGDDDEVAHHMRTIAYALYTYAGPEPSATLPPLLVTHAVLFFSTVWQHITQHPVSVNGEDIPFTILFSGASSRADDRTGWQGIAFEVAKQGVFGPMPSLTEAPFWDVLLYLYKCRFEILHNNH